MYVYRKPRAGLAGLARTRRKNNRSKGDRPNLACVARVCDGCGGAITICPVCRHAHCDDECIPIECLKAEEQQDEQASQDRS